MLERLRAAVAASGDPDAEARSPARPGAGRRRGRHRPPPPPDPAAEGREADPHEVARQIVLRQLTMAPRSRSELARKLAQRGCDPDVARAVLDRMEEVGLVDDAAYAQMFVRAKQSTRGLARTALRAELRRKGVAPEVLEGALDQVSEEDEREEAARLVAKKLATMHGLPAATQARRLAGLLARKGYPGGLAHQVVREALAGSPEHQRD